MSLDIRRVTQTPFKKLEKPKAQDFIIGRQIGALLETWLAPLAVLAAFLVTAWWWDAGASVGSGRRLVLVITLGLLTTLTVLVRVLGQKSGGRMTTAERILIVIGVLALGGSLFGGDWRTALGLNQIGAGPFLPELVLLFVWMSLVGRLRASFAKATEGQGEKYGQLILSALTLGSTVFALSVIARYFIFSNRDLLTTLSAQSWPMVLAVTALLAMILAMKEKGGARAVWSVALLVHVIAIFLFDENLSWVILLVATSLVLMVQVAYGQKLKAQNLVYPLQVWIAALLLLFVPVKFFTGFNPTLPERYSQAILGQTVRAGLSARSILPRGAGAATAVLEESAVSTLDLNLDTLQKSTTLPASPVIANSHIQLYFELGIIGSLSWLLFWLVFLRNGFMAGRGRWSSLDLGTIAFGLAVILLVSAAFTAWSLPLVWLLFTLVGVTWLLSGEASRTQASVLSEIWAKWRTSLQEKRIAPWLPRAGALIVIVLYVFLLSVSVRVVGAERAAAQAPSNDGAEVGVKYNHWEKAVKKNPWSNFYQLKLAQSKLDVLSDGMPISEQKEIFESITETLVKTSAAPSSDGAWPWLSAIIYGQMEKYVEGSVKLGQTAYLRAYKLWPNNLALAAQIAKFYREKTDLLVSSEVTASQLRSDGKDYLQHALKLDPGYLPARLELALLIEKDGDLPGAVAELEPWENDSPEIKYHLGRLQFNDNQTEIAIEKFLAVLKEVPNHSNARYSLGVAYYREKKYQEALAEFEKVLEMNPESEDVKGKIEEVKKKL